MYATSRMGARWKYVMSCCCQKLTHPPRLGHREGWGDVSWRHLNCVLTCEQGSLGKLGGGRAFQADETHDRQSMQQPSVSRKMGRVSLAGVRPELWEGLKSRGKRGSSFGRKGHQGRESKPGCDRQGLSEGSCWKPCLGARGG